MVGVILVIVPFVMGTVRGGGVGSLSSGSCSGMVLGSASSGIVANFLSTCFKAGRRMGLLEGKISIRYMCKI